MAGMHKTAQATRDVSTMYLKKKTAQKIYN